MAPAVAIHVDGGRCRYIYDYTYTANADTNQYTDVDGASFDYDALEQLTSDPTRGLGYAYDYKGQLVTEDRIGDTPGTPERHYSYDNQGRRRVEQAFYEGSNYHAQTIATIHPANDACFGGCGCANPGTLAMEELVYDDSGAFSHRVQYSYEPGALGRGYRNAGARLAALPYMGLAGPRRFGISASAGAKAKGRSPIRCRQSDDKSRPPTVWRSLQQCRADSGSTTAAGGSPWG